MGLAILPVQAAAAPTLVRTIEASTWGSPIISAPDPMGLTYDSERNRLIVVDAEVEEKVYVKKDAAGNTVNKTYLPQYWNGANFFEVSLSGTMDRTLNLATVTTELDPAAEITVWPTSGNKESPDVVAYLANPAALSDEMADIAYNPAGNGTYYIVDDDKDLVHIIPLGSNKMLDASDLPGTKFTTRDMTGDPEGLGYGLVSGTPTLFISAGEGPLSSSLDPATNQHRIHEIYKIQPGPNGVFDGPAMPDGMDPALWDSNGDDVMTHFDTCNPIDPLDQATRCTSEINQHDPEDVAYDPISGNLFFSSRDVPQDPNTPDPGNVIVVAETTVNGALVDTYNLGDIKSLRPSGIAVAPASGNASERSIYLADRGADNNSDRLKNDGRIFEFQLGGVVNRGPIFDPPPANRASDEGEVVDYQVVVDDLEGDPFTCTATGLPMGLAISTDCRVTGTIQPGAVVGSPYATKITAKDSNNLPGVANFQWIINDVTPPAPPAVLNIIKHTTGVHLDWPDSPEVDLAGYNVWRSSTVGGEFTKLNGALLTASDYFDSTAQANANSFYKVTAVDKSPTPNESDPTLGTVHRSKITFVSRSTAKGSGMTMVLKRPADVQTGDVLLAAFSARGSGEVLAPAGWKLVSQVTRTNSLTHQAIYSHTVGTLAAEKTSYTFSFFGRTASVGMIVAYRGAVEQVQKTGGQANPAANTIIAPSSVPTTSDSLQVAFFGIGTDTTITAPEGMIERSEVVMGSGPLRVTMQASDVIVDAGSVGTRVATSEKSADSIGQVVILKPTA